MNEKNKRDSNKFTVPNELETDVRTGLTAAEAQRRLQQFGANEIPEKEEPTWKRLLKRFWGPIPWMIETAALLSAAVRKWEDFAIIMILLLVNVAVDFFQERKALSALKVLKEKLAKQALVKRDGAYGFIESKFIVPGDIVKLKIGDIVPADAKLLNGEYLQVDQAALTGESLPVDKNAGDAVYGNSIVKMGEMEAMVTATGMRTFFGKSAALVVEAGKSGKSHFQKAVLKIGDELILTAATLAVVLIIVSLFRHDPMLEVLRFILVLVVASIPVALPAVMSVTLAIGALNLARKQAIVSRLEAIEELAGVDILCSDKTGTLTQNRMSIAPPAVYNGFSESDLFCYAALASKKENHDPIETPIFEKIEELHLNETLAGFTLQKFIPFDPIRKRTEANAKQGAASLTIVKGAPQVVLGLCDKEPAKKDIIANIEAFAGKGYRSLGVAIEKSGGSAFSFVGLIPLHDPPREDSKATIAEAKNLGISVKMITGDNQAIAREMARILDIGENILDTHELRNTGVSAELEILAEIVGGALYRKLNPAVSERAVKQFSDELVKEVAAKMTTTHLPHGHIRQHESEIIDVIENADGFSQVMPDDKYFIIDKLQKADHIVAMTGDGVNDAPALKKADAGIAVSGATDAARAAADLILLAPGLSVVINAFREARIVFERMKSYAVFRIAETIRVLLFMTLSILVFNFYPVTAVMIIILALLNDIPIMMIAYDNVRESATPIRWNMREVMEVSGILGTAGVVASFLLFYILMRFGISTGLIQTLIFLKLSVAGHLTIYTTRTWERHFWKKPFPALTFFIPAFGTQIVATFVAVYGVFMPAIGWTYAGYIWLYAVVWFVVNDFIKVASFAWLSGLPNDNKITER